MSVSTMKTGNGNGSCETPGGTVVHINITQRSTLERLFNIFCHLPDEKISERTTEPSCENTEPSCEKTEPSCEKTEPSREKTETSCEKTEPSHSSDSAVYLGFGVSYMSLGLVFLMLAVIIFVVNPGLSYFEKGLYFSIAGPFVVSGALNLMAYKYPNTIWMPLAFYSLLVNFGVAVFIIVRTAEDINRLMWITPPEDVCSKLQIWPRDDSASELYRCLYDLRAYKTLEIGLGIMILLMSIWGLCLSVLGVGCELWSCCCSSTMKKTHEDEDALIKPNPSDDIIIV